MNGLGRRAAIYVSIKAGATSKGQEKLREQLSLLESEEEITDDIYKDKLEVLKYGLEQDFNFSTKHIPGEIIDAFAKNKFR